MLPRFGTSTLQLVILNPIPMSVLNVWTTCARESICSYDSPASHRSSINKRWSIWTHVLPTSEHLLTFSTQTNEMLTTLNDCPHDVSSVFQSPILLGRNCLTLAAIPKISNPLVSYVAPCHKACGNQSRPWQGSCVSLGKQFTLAKRAADYQSPKQS